MNTRRQFLKTATLATAAVATSTILPQEAAAASRSKQPAIDSEWDVIVVGGGPAGCTAAISAAREGGRVLLLEAMGQLGGMGTAGMVPAWCPFSDGQKIIYRGLAEKIFRESKKGVPHESGSKLDWVVINPEYLMQVYDRFVAESGAKVLFFSRLAAVEMRTKDTIDHILVANKSGLVRFRAKVYIDATGDGDLAAWAGASFKRGDEEGKVQSSSLCFSLANVDTYHFLHGPNMHTSNPNSPVYKAIQTGRYPLIDNHVNACLIGPGVVQFNAGHIVNLDSTDPWATTVAMHTGREIAEQYLEAFRETHPKAFGSAFLVKTASLLGVRDSRRIEGDYTFTVDDWMARSSFPDEIGRNCYYIDVHKPGHKATRYGKGESHGIPYRCLTPKGLRNVLTAGRCISTDEEAFGSLRVMPPCLVTGEAAGMAAMHAIQSTQCDVHRIDVNHLRDRLRQEGAYFQ